MMVVVDCNFTPLLIPSKPPRQILPARRHQLPRSIIIDSFKKKNPRAVTGGLEPIT
jgi:hypothetical protein